MGTKSFIKGAATVLGVISEQIPPVNLQLFLNVIFPILFKNMLFG